MNKNRCNALLPLVLERGYADCPDMTRLTKKLAKLYGVPVVGVSNVGPVTGGAWAGWKCIGNSIALFGDGESGVTLPYGEDAVCLRIIDVPLRKDSRYGTALATEVEAAR